MRPCAARPGVVVGHVRTHLAAMAAAAPGGLPDELWMRVTAGSRLRGHFQDDSVTFNNPIQ